VSKIVLWFLNFCSFSHYFWVWEVSIGPSSKIFILSLATLYLVTTHQKHSSILCLCFLFLVVLLLHSFSISLILSPIYPYMLLSVSLYLLTLITVTLNSVFDIFCYF
jgi:hypothetical protein